MRSRRGISLVELICAFGLMAVISFFTLFVGQKLSAKVDSEIMDIEAERIVSYIQSIRETCLKNRCSLEIVPDVTNDRLILMESGRMVEVFKIENQLDFYALNKREGECNNWISVNGNGAMTPCTLLLNTPDARLIRISVRVGSSYVQKK